MARAVLCRHRERLWCPGFGGRLLGTAEFAANSRGYDQLAGWLESWGAVGRVRTGDGHSIDAIRYHSASDKPDGVCWVVFVENGACVNNDSEAAKQARGREDLLMILHTNSVRCHERGDPPESS